MSRSNAYHDAQRALADLKGAIYEILSAAPGDGLTNAEIGRSLGIYAGHVGHEGHVSRTLLAMMESESVVEQVETTKKWRLKQVIHYDDRTNPGD